jgi:hypothetical protein
MESVTLPTRIRASAGQQGSMALLEAALNTTGNQTIFDLRSSVDDDHQHQANGHTNGELSNQTKTLVEEDTEAEVSASTFDISYIDGQSTPADHRFGQIEVYRHSVRPHAPTSLPDPVRSQQVQDDETIVAKFDDRVPFPMLDTFPDTLFRVDHASSLNMRAGLVTTSRTKRHVLDLRNLTVRAFDVDEREAMYNDLTEIANNYTHGWESGSDSGDDS